MALVAGSLGVLSVVAARLLHRVQVRGPSMAPAFEDGDRLVVGPAWGLRKGDVVVLAEPDGAGLLAVKRVAAFEAGSVRVLGDNLGVSIDSRTYGPVPVGAIRGRVLWRYYPPGRTGRPTRDPHRAGGLEGAL